MKKINITIASLLVSLTIIPFALAVTPSEKNAAPIDQTEPVDSIEPKTLPSKDKNELLRQKFAELSRDQKLDLLAKLRAKKNIKATVEKKAPKKVLPKLIKKIDPANESTSDKRANLIARMKQFKTNSSSEKNKNISIREQVKEKNKTQVLKSLTKKIQQKKLKKDAADVAEETTEKERPKSPFSRYNTLVKKSEFNQKEAETQKNEPIAASSASNIKNKEETKISARKKQKITNRMKELRTKLQTKREENMLSKSLLTAKINTLQTNPQIITTQNLADSEQKKSDLKIIESKKEASVIRAMKEANELREIPKNLNIFNAISAAKQVKSMTEYATEKRTQLSASDPKKSASIQRKMSLQNRR